MLVKTPNHQCQNTRGNYNENSDVLTREWTCFGITGTVLPKLTPYLVM